MGLRLNIIMNKNSSLNHKLIITFCKTFKNYQAIIKMIFLLDSRGYGYAITSLLFDRPVLYGLVQFQ